MHGGSTLPPEDRSQMTSRRALIRGGQVYDHDGNVHKPAVADILIETMRHLDRPHLTMAFTKSSMRPAGWSCPD